MSAVLLLGYCRADGGHGHGLGTGFSGGFSGQNFGGGGFSSGHHVNTGHPSFTHQHSQFSHGGSFFGNVGGVGVSSIHGGGGQSSSFISGGTSYGPQGGHIRGTSGRVSHGFGNSQGFSGRGSSFGGGHISSFGSQRFGGISYGK